MVQGMWVGTDSLPAPDQDLASSTLMWNPDACDLDLGVDLCAEYQAKGVTFVMHVGDSLTVNGVLNHRRHVWHQDVTPGVQSCWQDRHLGYSEFDAHLNDCTEAFVCNGTVRLSTLFMPFVGSDAAPTGLYGDSPGPYLVDELYRWLLHLHHFPVRERTHGPRVHPLLQEWESLQVSRLLAQTPGASYVSLLPEVLVLTLGARMLVPDRPDTTARAVASVVDTVLGFVHEGWFSDIVLQHIQQSASVFPAATATLDVNGLRPLHPSTNASTHYPRPRGTRLLWVSPFAPFEPRKPQTSQWQHSHLLLQLDQHYRHAAAVRQVPYLDVMGLTNLVADSQCLDGVHYSATANQAIGWLLVHWTLFG
jgi:hypothetical protein